MGSSIYVDKQPMFTFEDYVRAHYLSYAAWWRNEKALLLRDMRKRFLDWQHAQVQSSSAIVNKKSEMNQIEACLEKLDEDEKLMPFEPPDYYRIDELQFHLKTMEQRGQ